MMVVQVVVGPEMVREDLEGETTVKMLLIMPETGVTTFQLQMIGITRSIQDLLRTQKYLQLRPHQMVSPPQNNRNKREKINTTLKHRRHRLPNISNLKLLDRIETRITMLIVLLMGRHNMKWRPVKPNRPLFRSSKVR